VSERRKSSNEPLDELLSEVARYVPNRTNEQMVELATRARQPNDREVGKGKLKES
jgi:hypothetical protein